MGGGGLGREGGASSYTYCLSFFGFFVCLVFVWFGLVFLFLCLFLVLFFKTGFLYIALAVLELTL